MMRYTLSRHAQEMLARRAIRLEWLERALGDPMRTERDRMDPALEHRLAPIVEQGGRVLRVIVNPAIDPLVVVTVYFDRRERSGP